jgi:hypothetical protein
MFGRLSGSRAATAMTNRPVNDGTMAKLHGLDVIHLSL